MALKFVSEEVITKVTLQLEEDPDGYTAIVEEFGAAQPTVLGFICSDNFDLLTREEREFLLYLSLIIWHSFKAVHPNIPMVTEKELGDLDEANWNTLNEIDARRFRERVDIFFHEYSQEDLLAFVEDALMDDHDSFVTREGREPMFIALKSIIDTFSFVLKEQMAREN